MSQARRESGTDSPFEASRIEFYTRDRKPQEDDSMEKRISETRDFFATYSGEGTFRDVAGNEIPLDEDDGA